MTPKRPRISWKQENVEKAFIEACLHEITVNGREGGSLKPISWKNVGEKLQKEYDFVVDQKQMKNRYDYIKAKFTAWLKLKNKRENAYDPTKNKFNLEEAEWQTEIKSNKYAKSLRSTPLLYPDLCIQLFDGLTSTPSSNLPNNSQELTNHSLNENNDVNSQRELNLILNENNDANSKKEQTPVASDESSSACSKNRTTKRKREDSLDSKILEVMGQISKVVKMLIEKNTVVDNVDACMEKLETFKWGSEDPRYNTALLLFGESNDLRKVWLCLKPGSCENWIRNAGRKYGYGLL